MADENKSTETDITGTPEPSKSTIKSLKKDYRDATPKERLTKFKVDPITKTLRRA